MSGFISKFAIAAAATITAAGVNAQSTNNTAVTLDDIDSQSQVTPAEVPTYVVPAYNVVPPEIENARPRPRNDEIAPAPTAPITYDVRGVQRGVGPGDIVQGNIRDWQGAPGPFGTFQGRRPPIGNPANPTDPLWRYYDRGVDVVGDAFGIGDSRAWQRFAGRARADALTQSRMSVSFNIHCDGKSPEQIQAEVERMYTTGETTNCAKQIDNPGRWQQQRLRNLGNGLGRDIWYGTGLADAIPQILPGPRVGR